MNADTANRRYDLDWLRVLAILFVYSLLCYHLFVDMKGNGRRVLDRIASWLSIPGVTIVGFSIPLVILEILIPRAVLAVGAGGWGFLHYCFKQCVDHRRIAKRRPRG